MKYYIAGVPYSDELYHYGILGQKWGVRRYQNRDGSLTSEGRKHYGVKSEGPAKVKQALSSAGQAIGTAAKKTGTAVGKAAKATATYAGKRFKMSHPSLLSDSELKEYTNRIIQENNYKDMVQKLNSKSVARKAASGALKFVGDILLDGSKTLAQAGFKRIANEVLETDTSRKNRKLDVQLKELDLSNKEYQTSMNQQLHSADRKRVKEFLNVINNPTSTATEVNDAFDRLQKYGDVTSTFRGGKKK